LQAAVRTRLTAAYSAAECSKQFSSTAADSKQDKSDTKDFSARCMPQKLFNIAL
jgi:hypothetical protein